VSRFPHYAATQVNAFPPKGFLFPSPSLPWLVGFALPLFASPLTKETPFVKTRLTRRRAPAAAPWPSHTVFSFSYPGDLTRGKEGGKRPTERDKDKEKESDAEEGAREGGGRETCSIRSPLLLLRWCPMNIISGFIEATAAVGDD
jgi:hypothetical protein